MSKIITKFASKFEEHKRMKANKRKLSKVEYDIRTLNYYLAQGGVYADLLAALTKLRDTATYRGLPASYIVLNEASFLCDNVLLAKEREEDYLGLFEKETKIIIAYVAAVLMADKAELKEEDALRIEKHCIGLGEIKSFLNLITKYRSKEESEGIAELKAMVAQLREQAPLDIDKALTFNGILDYISQHKQYQFVAPIINMLKDITHSVITEEQYQRLVEVEKKIMEESYVQEVHNHNTISGSNVFPGNVNNPSFPINK